MSVMGTKVDSFQDPVCSSFKPKIRNDQLCYEINLEEFKDPTNLHQQLKQGLVLIIDCNEERQMASHDPKYVQGAQENKFKLEEENTFQIHLDTKSTFFNHPSDN